MRGSFELFKQIKSVISGEDKVMIESTSDKEKHDPNKRLVFLDSIRGIAALAVFFQHSGEHLWSDFETFTHNSFNFGKFGVVIFFLTSGFIIPLSLEKGKSVIRFWLGRFFRLYPLYWTSLFIFLLLYLIGFNSALSKNFQTALVRNFLISISMLQDFVRFPQAQGHYYTLSLELAFYVACTVLFLLKLHKKSYLSAWVVLGVMLFSNVLVPVKIERRLPMAGMFDILSMFVGTVFYRYYSSLISKSQLVRLLVVVAGVTIVGVYINYVLYKKQDYTDQFTFSAVMLPWVLGYIFFIGAFTFRNINFPSLFSWLGKISYSVYLLHPVFLIITPPVNYKFISLSIMLAGTPILSTFTYYLIEKPMISRGRSFTKKFILNP